MTRSNVKLHTLCGSQFLLSTSTACHHTHPQVYVNDGLRVLIDFEKILKGTACQHLRQPILVLELSLYTNTYMGWVRFDSACDYTRDPARDAPCAALQSSFVFRAQPRRALENRRIEAHTGRRAHPFNAREGALIPIFPVSLSDLPKPGDDLQLPPGLNSIPNNPHDKRTLM